jgi:hypothetical protein
MKVSPKSSLLKTLLERVLNEAESLRRDAGFSGSHSDGGASRMESEVEFFKFGMANEIPPAWVPIAEQLRAEEDSEYPEYLRLKKKFKENN